MNETCDRCGPATRAAYRADNPHGASLTFCGHCAQRNFQALGAGGWTITPLTRISDAPQLAQVAS